MDIKKLLENYNEFLFADGYIIDQQLGVIDERAISDFLTAHPVKNLSLGGVIDSLPVTTEIWNKAQIMPFDDFFKWLEKLRQ